MNVNQFNSIKKELITQNVLVPQIKFLNFTAKQINNYKKSKDIIIVRKQSEVEDINLGDFIKPEWGIIYEVTDIQLINDISQYKDYGLIDPQILADLLGDYKQILKVIKLTKYIKKNIRRYFYDCEFDQTQHGIKLISIGIVDENGNELYLINKDYDWSTTSKWLYQNVYPYIKEAPDYYKISFKDIKEKIIQFIKPTIIDDIKLYGYYSAYDHVVLSQIFGRMVDLPQGMPMYTNDLKQIIDYFGINIKKIIKEQQTNEHDALSDAKWNLKLFNRIKQLLNVNI